MGKILSTSNLMDYCILEEDSYYNDEPLFFTFKSIAKSSPTTEIHGTGTSFVKKIAKNRALGEALERYSLIHKKEDKIYYYTYNELPGNHINLPQFANKDLHSRKVFMDKKIGWVIVKKINMETNLSSFKDYYAPAQLIYVPYSYAASEPLIQQPISTGAALQVNFKESLITGILEILERDSFIISFYTHKANYRLDLNEIEDKELKNILSELERNLLEYHFLDISNFKGINVILCIIFDKSGEQPRIVSGMGTDFNLKKAVVKSIEEALQLRPWLRDAFSEDKIKKVPKKQITDYFDRVAYWNLNISINKIKKRLIFYLNLPLKKVTTEEFTAKKNISIENKLSNLFQISKSENFELFFIDITPDFIKNKYFVIKVLIPQAQPFFLNEKFSYLSIKRLHSNGRVYTKHPHFFL